MLIRQHLPGDDEAQALIFNEATRTLPAFKPATAAEIARRNQVPGSRLYAVEGGEVVGYAAFNPNGRVGHPWCIPGHEAAREPLMGAILDAMRGLGMTAAWAAYRADWSPVLEFLDGHGFRKARDVVNYVAEVDRLPRAEPPAGTTIGPLAPADLPRLIEIAGGLLADDLEQLQSFYWNNPYFGPDALFALRPTGGGPIAGAGLVVTGSVFADPAKVDPAMPCFRLGAMGNEAERLKRIKGVVSFAFEETAAGVAMLGEAARRLVDAGLTLAAAQAPSDRPALVAFYDDHFDRQGAFPILVRRLDA